MLKIGNAQAFWGDSGLAPARLVEQQPDLDYLTLDYLAEVSLSIMAVQQEKDPSAGFARDFLSVVRSLIPLWKQGKRVKVVTNAGGLNPRGCAEQCLELLKRESCLKKIGLVTGDNVLSQLKRDPSNAYFNNLDTLEPLTLIQDRLVTANAYMGAAPIAEALTKGAEIVITGRMADPSLTVGPCIAHFHWRGDAFDRIAGATVAGHLIECGTQVTGGISCDWLALPDPVHIGFPIVEIASDGSFTLTKPPHTGGAVTIRSVKEQLLYEIGDPARYLSPDATLSFLNLDLKEVGKDRIHISGALGAPPPSTLKVSATFKEGFRTEGTLTLFGDRAAEKGRRAGEVLLTRLQEAGFPLQRSLIECIGSGDLMPGILPKIPTKECLLRIAVADSRYEAVECFAREFASLVTSGPPGIGGYTSGRPAIRPVFGYWPCLIPKIESTVELL